MLNEKYKRHSQTSIANFHGIHIIGSGTTGNVNYKRAAELHMEMDFRRTLCLER